jgi:hypothetical protein
MSGRWVVLIGGLILVSSGCGSRSLPVKTGTADTSSSSARTTGTAGTTGAGGTAGSSTEGGEGPSPSVDASTATGKNILMVVGDSNETNPVGTLGTAKGTPTDLIGY